MSLELLGQNWNSIVKKVIEPLWNKKFKEMYTSVKLDKDDFLSLSGEELTKAFKNYNPEKANLYTYSTTVITRKATTEFRNMKRDKRVGDAYAESIYKKVDDEANSTLEDIIENLSDGDSKDYLEIESVFYDISLVLKPKEVEVLKLSMHGLNNMFIAKMLHIDIKEVNDIKRGIASKSEINRILRIHGFLGGNEDDEI